MSLTTSDIIFISLGVVFLSIFIYYFFKSSSKNVNTNELVSSFQNLSLDQKIEFINGINNILLTNPDEYKMLEETLERDFYKDENNYESDKPYISSKEERNYIRDDMRMRDPIFIRDDTVQRDMNFSNTEMNRIKMNKMMSQNLR